MRRILLSLLTGLLVAGCGDVSLPAGGLDGLLPVRLDTGPLEETIASEIELGAEGVRIDRVDCPGTIEPAAGTVFVCRVHAADGSVGTVEVRQVDDDGSVEWELTDVRPPATP